MNHYSNPATPFPLPLYLSLSGLQNYRPFAVDINKYDRLYTITYITIARAITHARTNRIMKVRTTPPMTAILLCFLSHRPQVF